VTRAVSGHLADPSQLELFGAPRRDWRPLLGTVNCFQAGSARRGAGSIPASCRICHTVEAAIWWPSRTSSPCARRCPRVYREDLVPPAAGISFDSAASHSRSAGR
jgi:hypothetical protein